MKNNDMEKLDMKLDMKLASLPKPNLKNELKQKINLSLAEVISEDLKDKKQAKTKDKVIVNMAGVAAIALFLLLALIPILQNGGSHFNQEITRITDHTTKETVKTVISAGFKTVNHPYDNMD